MSTPEQWPGTSPATGSATGPDATTPHAPTSAVEAASVAPTPVPSARPAAPASGPTATPSGSGDGDVSGSGRESGSGDGPGSGSGHGSGTTSSGSGTGSGRESEADVRYVAERLLASVREDLGRADAKAAILLSGAVALVAVLLTAQRGSLGREGGVPPSAHWAQTVLALGGGLLWAAGLVMLVTVLVPRTRIAADRTFMRDVTAGVSADVLLPKLTDSSTDVVRWTLDQACALGAVLARKYAWLRWGICCLALGAIFTLFSQLWG